MEVNYQLETTLPEVPEPTSGNTLECLRAIKEILNVREGIAGDKLDQVVTHRELYLGGRWNRSPVDGMYRAQLPDFGPVALPAAAPISVDFNPPPPATGLTATGALANVILDWNDAQYHNHAYTEIWRSGTNDLGTAVRIGTWLQPAYADNLGQTGLTRFYWIRHVSLSGVPGPFNGTAGTSATTGFVDTPNIADFAVTNAKIGNLAVDNAKIANVTITGGKIAASTITASNMVAGTITAASGIINDINADIITTGSLRGINVNAASHTTKGSYLTSALSGGETTVNVKNTADFPTGGTFFAVVYDTNAFDQNMFGYTGKTATTLTGCFNVQAHNNGATIVPAGVKTAVLDGNVNEFRLRGDRGDGTIDELASIGIKPSGGDTVIGFFGSLLGTRIAVKGVIKDTSYAVWAESVGTGFALAAVASSGSGLPMSISRNNTNGHIFFGGNTTFPSNKQINVLTQVSNRLHYSDGTHWKPLTTPYFESSEQTLTAGSSVTVAHGITDGAGNGIVPAKFECYLRCKTAEFGYSVGDELMMGSFLDNDTLSITGIAVYADSTNVGFTPGQNGIKVVHKTNGSQQGLTFANWKALLRCF